MRLAIESLRSMVFRASGHHANDCFVVRDGLIWRGNGGQEVNDVKAWLGPLRDEAVVRCFVSISETVAKENNAGEQLDVRSYLFEVERTSVLAKFDRHLGFSRASTSSKCIQVLQIDRCVVSLAVLAAVYAGRTLQIAECLEFRGLFDETVPCTSVHSFSSGLRSFGVGARISGASQPVYRVKNWY